jgi:hypothetical protein
MLLVLRVNLSSLSNLRAAAGLLFAFLLSFLPPFTKQQDRKKWQKKKATTTRKGMQLVAIHTGVAAGSALLYVPSRPSASVHHELHQRGNSL